MEIKHILEILNQYYLTTRRVGHTQAMIHGAKSVPEAIIVAHTHDYAMELRKQIGPDTHTATLHTLQHDLIGQRSPLLIDNGALHTLLAMSLDEISRLRATVTHLTQELNSISGIKIS